MCYICKNNDEVYNLKNKLTAGDVLTRQEHERLDRWNLWFEMRNLNNLPLKTLKETDRLNYLKEYEFPGIS